MSPAATRRLQCEARPSCRKRLEKRSSMNYFFRLAESCESASGKSAEGLLGRTGWIYRLTCSEDVRNLYELEHELGRGDSSIVYSGRHKILKDCNRAIKIVPKSRDDAESQMLMNELYTLMDFDHPNILNMLRAYDDGQYIYIVSDLCRGPTLSKHLADGIVTEPEAGVNLRHMLKAVQYCHSHYTGHYDIKPENFMFTDVDCKKLKMIDFGMAGGFRQDLSKLKGTVAYTAPEVFCGMYGPAADIWSCGVVLFAMVTRESFCPSGVTQEQMAGLLRDGRWVKNRLRWASEKVSKECLDLLTRMLCCDRHMRITARDAMKHPFIQNSYGAGEYFGDVSENHQEEEAAIRILRSMTTKFEAFGKEPVLVRAALLVMVHIGGHTLKEARLHRLAYYMLDRTGSGELSLDSLEVMMTERGLELPANLESAFKVVDLTKSGYITYSSFLAATLPLSFRCREDLLRRVFNLLDRNGDGYIDEQDLAATFLSDKQKSETKFHELCSQAIVEVSGSAQKKQINFDEFLFIMIGNNKPIAADGFGGR